MVMMMITKIRIINDDDQSSFYCSICLHFVIIAATTPTRT